MHGNRGSGANRMTQFSSIRSMKRWLTCPHLVEDRPKRKQVGTSVNLLTSRLFGRHVACRTNDCSNVAEPGL